MDSVLVDSFGRVADDLRISVTDRCNFRCTYCMPAEGLQWLPREQILDYEELRRLTGVFAGLGVKAVKITGGEPTVRANLATLVRMLHDVRPDFDISMTTNGVLLDGLANELAAAGLSRVSISLDSMLRHRFEEMTRRDALERVFAGIGAAWAAGLDPVKINCVVVRGTNDDELVDFARWSRETGSEIRFIEYMPLDAEQRWERDKVFPSSQVLADIHAAFPLEPVSHGHEPATSYRFTDGAPGGIGVISSVTEPFCDTCNRLRLTAEGMLRTCLFSLEETNLREPMRAGATDEELATLIRGAVAHKWSGHRINHPDFVRPEKSMSMIGG